MATTALTEFYARVMPELPNCPKPMILPAIRDVTRAFCRKTLAWQEELDAIKVVEDLADYDLDIPGGTNLVGVVLVTVDEVVIDPTTDYAEDIANKTVTLIPTPGANTADGEDGMVVTVALEPSLTADSIRADIYSRHGETLAYGIMGRLMVMPKKSWTNPQLGTYYTNIFFDRMGEETAEVKRGTLGTSLTVEIGTDHDFAV